MVLAVNVYPANVFSSKKPFMLFHRPSYVYEETLSPTVAAEWLSLKPAAQHHHSTTLTPTPRQNTTHQHITEHHTTHIIQPPHHTPQHTTHTTHSTEHHTIPHYTALQHSNTNSPTHLSFVVGEGIPTASASLGSQSSSMVGL